MEDFEVIYETDNILGDYLKCKHCGERIERGIETVSHHWVHCLKRKEGLIIVETDTAKKVLDKLSINVNL